jgi:protoheme IX farnesyltransferase
MKLLNSSVPRHTNLFSDYILLMKPELTLLSVLTAVGSAFIALHGSKQYSLLVHTFIGTILIGGAAGVLNQYLERRYDAMMKRTERRPLPAGRIPAAKALLFGNILCFAGLSYLAIFTNWIAVSLSLLTLVSYLVIYTPLKRKTPFATLIGGIPGALPPLIGWAVVQNGISMEAWSLFFILFFWQIPHFLSLAWMYRNDYIRARYRLLTVLDTTGDVTSRQILVYSIALIPVSLMPLVVGLTGVFYFFSALIFSIGFIIVALHFYRVRTNSAARQLFLASLFLLPALFLILML